MFRANLGFIPGYNDVRITDAGISQIKDYWLLNLEMTNQYSVKNTFSVFLNNSYLLNQLLSVTYQSYSLEDEFNEKDFIGVELSVYLVPEKGYYKITKFKEYTQDEAS